jgi:nuclear pore complex protein Nup62
MGKDLTSMIEEVNSASSTLTKTNKADEPVCSESVSFPCSQSSYSHFSQISQIVRILNSHLSQLQVIDMGTSELQAKLDAAQKAGQSISARLGYGYPNTGTGNDSASDDFYRSFMQGR